MYYFSLDSEMVRMFSGLLTSEDRVRLPRHQKDQNLQFVFQRVFDRLKQGKRYGDFQWRIGILRPVER